MTRLTRVALIALVMVVGVGEVRAGGLFYGWDDPIAYKYKGLGGGEEIYVIVRYEMENRGREAEFDKLRWSIVTDSGRQLDAAFHPLVAARYCKEASCDPMTMRANRDVMPGARGEALAIFGELSSAPASLRVIGRGFDRIWVQRQCTLGIGGEHYACEDVGKKKPTAKKPPQ